MMMKSDGYAWGDGRRRRQMARKGRRDVVAAEDAFRGRDGVLVVENDLTVVVQFKDVVRVSGVGLDELKEVVEVSVANANDREK